MKILYAIFCLSIAIGLQAEDAPPLCNSYSASHEQPKDQQVKPEKSKDQEQINDDDDIAWLTKRFTIYFMNRIIDLIAWAAKNPDEKDAEKLKQLEEVKQKIAMKHDHYFKPPL